MDATTKLPITSLKRTCAFLLMLAFSLADLIKDFSLNKAVSLGFTLAENQDILSIGKQALAELKDLDVEESRELTAFIGVNFDLEDDTLELRIESALELLPEAYALIKTNLAFYNKARKFIKNWGGVTEAQVIELDTKIQQIDLSPGSTFRRRNVA